MGHAKYVGRVGALAVALGIGTAVITTPGNAWADETGASSNEGSSQNAPGDGAGRTGEQDTPGANTSTPSMNLGSSDPAPTSATGTTTVTTSTTSRGSATTTVGGGSTTEVSYGSSTVTGSIGTTHQAAPSTAPESVSPIVVESSTPSTVVVTTVASTPAPTAVEAIPTVEQPAVSLSATPTASGSLQALANTPALARITSTARTTASAPADQVARRSFGESQAPDNFDTFLSTNSLQDNTFNALIAPAAMPAVPSLPAPSLAKTVLAIPGVIISTALDLLTRTLTVPGDAPVDNPLLWAVLAFVRRQSSQSATLASPFAAPVQTGQNIDGGLLRAASATPTALAGVPTPIPDPNTFGSLADYTSQDELKDILHVAIHPWKTGSTESVTTASDPATGSSSSFASVTITRPLGDQSRDRVYVVEVLNDYVKYFDRDILGIPADKRQVISIIEIQPGESVTVPLRRVNIFSFPEGPGGRRVTLTEQTTDAFIAKFVYSEEDVTPPTAPTLALVSTTQSTIKLSVSGSTDNVGVVGYTIYRDGIAVGNATDATFTDSGLSLATTYSYTATAFDLAGNISPSSSPPLVVTTDGGLNVAPVSAGAPVDRLDQSNGQVVGFIAASDADGDPLSYEITTGAVFGTARIVADTGRWSYLPDDAARNLEAGVFDHFDVTITDGRGGIVHQLVSVPVLPKPPGLGDFIDDPLDNFFEPLFTTLNAISLVALVTPLAPIAIIFNVAIGAISLTIDVGQLIGKASACVDGKVYCDIDGIADEVGDIVTDVFGFIPGGKLVGKLAFHEAVEAGTHLLLNGAIGRLR